MDYFKNWTKRIPIFILIVLSFKNLVLRFFDFELFKNLKPEFMTKSKELPNTG
jgi:hypothetical protein